MTETKLKPVTRDEWVAALRSGKYRQTRGMLKRERGGYCCLGVLCHLAGMLDSAIVGDFTIHPTDYDAPDGMADVFTAVGLTNAAASELAKMNDSGDRFVSIADEIERIVPAVAQ